MHEGGEEGDEDKLQLEHGDDGGVMAEYSRSRQLGCGCYRNESTFAFVSLLPPPARTRSPALDVFHLRCLLRKGRENRKVSAKISAYGPTPAPPSPRASILLLRPLSFHPLSPTTPSPSSLLPSILPCLSGVHLRARTSWPSGLQFIGRCVLMFSLRSCLVRLLLSVLVRRLHDLGLCRFPALRPVSY